MIIIPAIDIKDGKVVRFTKGRFNKKVYSLDPVKIALEWQRQGAKFLHLVDLDGAMHHDAKNLPIIKKIIKALKIPVEVGGGIRDEKAIKNILGLGAKRVVLGTKAIEDPEFLASAIKSYRSKIAVGLDISGEKIGLYGWKKLVNLKVKELLKKLEGYNLKTLICTDIKRDGTMSGVDLVRIKELAGRTKIQIIVSGGISSLEDIRSLKMLKLRNLKGVIIGKALYEQRFTLPEAIKTIKEGR